ncbi:TolC family protein [Cupriavidus sp. H19C3]|uniref:TolC family protein n=1 Tax=Cupriavidus sp. H19C3 TaxID=3241603 RepID=UPI003BF7A1EA
MARRPRWVQWSAVAVSGMLGASALAQPPRAELPPPPRFVDADAAAATGPSATSPTSPTSPTSAAAVAAVAVAASDPAGGAASPHAVTRVIAAVQGYASAAFQPFMVEMVNKALIVSPEVREAAAKWQAADFDVSQARGQRWPQVQVGAATPSAAFGGGASNNTATSPLGTVQINTPLFDWGRIRSTIESRGETSRAAYQELEVARQKVSFDTASAVLELLRQHQALDRTHAYVKRMAELVVMLNQIVMRDAGRRSELTQARARLLQALSSRDQVIARMRESEVTLYKLVGEEVTLPEHPQWQAIPIGLQTAIDGAQTNPALEQSRAEARAAGYYADSVRAGRWPQVSWIISKTTQPDSLGRSQPWLTSVGLQWNAFQGGSAQAAERAARQRQEAGEQRAQSVLRDLEYRLRTSAEQRDAASTRATQFGALSVETDRVRKAFFDQWYHLGRRTLLDVLIAETDYYNNRIAEVNGRFDADAADLRMRNDGGLMLAWLLGTADM